MYRQELINMVCEQAKTIARNSTTTPIVTDVSIEQIKALHDNLLPHNIEAFSFFLKDSVYKDMTQVEFLKEHKDLVISIALAATLASNMACVSTLLDPEMFELMAALQNVVSYFAAAKENGNDTVQKQFRLFSLQAKTLEMLAIIDADRRKDGQGE